MIYKMEKNLSYKFENNTIILDRELIELDIFLKNFLEVLKKHSDYLVVSGFVSISSGRPRGTEDIDVLFQVTDFNKFKELFEDLIDNNFWCYQGDNPIEIYNYIRNKNNIRFSREDEYIPNIELIPIDESRKAKYFEFTHPQKIKIKDFEFKIPPIEFEILYKEIILTGKKDIEDAKHLREFYSDILNNKKFKEFEPIIRSELR